MASRWKVFGHPMGSALLVGALMSSGVALAASGDDQSAQEGSNSAHPNDPTQDHDHRGPDHEHHERHERHEEEGLQEVIVTAQKREENLQNAPVTVTAVTGDDLARAGINNALGLTDVVPGLEVGNFGSTTMFTIRGVTTNTDANLGDSPSAFHIDGVYQGRPAAASGLFYDVSRVEVLSGPQGTLYGKDSTSGTINVISNKPTFDGLHAQIEQEVGSYDLYRTSGMINVPVDDDLAVRFAFQTERHKGYLATGYDDADDIAGRLHVLWHPSSNLSILFSQDYFHEGGYGSGQVPIAELPGDNWSKDPWSVNLPIAQEDLVDYGFTPKTNNVSAQTSLQVDWSLDWATFTSVSAYHHLHLYSTSYLNGVASLQEETDQEISQELRLSSPSTSAIKWVAGAYYHRENQTNDLYFYDQAGPGVDSDQIFPKIDTPTYALFGQVTYPILPSWRVTAGARATDDHKTIQGSINQYNWLVVNPQDLVIPLQVPVVVDRNTPVDVGCPEPTPSVCQQASPNGSMEARRVTWRFGMDYDVAPKSMVYYNVSTGYKQGGLDANQAPNNVYRPETITAYEIGTKNRFLDDRLQVNLDAYLYNYKNYQVDQLEYFQGESALVFGDFISNAASARHKGVELETKAQLTRHDLLSLNVSYLRAVFESFESPIPANPGIPVLGIQYENLSGYTEYSAPEWTATLSLQHTWELPHGAQLALNAMTHAETFYWLSPDHQPDSRQPSYTRTQVALQYSDADDKYEVQAYVHNLENRPVYNNYTFQGQPTALVPGPIGFGPGSGSLATRNFESVDPPRTFGVSLLVRF